MDVYDGVLRKPFLAENWYKGIVAALAIWLPVFWLVVEGFSATFTFAIVTASTVSVIVAAAAFTYHEGFSLDPQQRRYRCYTWVLGGHFGAWQPLPTIAHILVRPFQNRYDLPMSEPGAPAALGFTATERGWQVLLSVAGSPIGIIAAQANQQKAEEIANALGNLMNVAVLNFPSRK